MSHHTPDERLTLRAAGPSDLEDIATVAQQGFPDDPEYDYRFPRRDEYPDDHRRWTVQEYREYLMQPEKYAVMIVTASDNQDRPVSLSVWDLSTQTPHHGGDLGVPDDTSKGVERKDVNAEHFREFKRSMAAGFETHFGKHGNNQMHLWLLCTCPTFRRRGAATMLCSWGLEKAAKENIPTTVLASRMGKLLYEELGFRLNGSFIIQLKGESEMLEIWAQTYPRPTRLGWLPRFITMFWH